MDRELYGYLMRWISLHQEWQKILEGGAVPSKITDGQWLNGIRNRLEWVIRDMECAGYTLIQLIEEAEKNGFVLPESMKELPPEMSPKYMKDGDMIKVRAEEALEAYKNSPDYLYVMENMFALDEVENSQIIDRLKRDTDFVRILAWLIQRERLPEMRKYLEVSHYLEKLAHAKELLMMRIDYLQPFS